MNMHTIGDYYDGEKKCDKEFGKMARWKNELITIAPLVIVGVAVFIVALKYTGFDALIAFHLAIETHGINNVISGN